MAENTTQSLKSAKREKTNAELAAETKAALAKSKTEKVKEVTVPTILKSHFGSTVFVAVNGVYVNVPVDGEPHKIPETLAKHLEQMIKDLK